MAWAKEYYDFFCGIMAQFLDAETNKEFINISSTSKDMQAGPVGRVVGLPVLPHQPAIEVCTCDSAHGSCLPAAITGKVDKALPGLTGSDWPADRWHPSSGVPWQVFESPNWSNWSKDVCLRWVDTCVPTRLWHYSTRWPNSISTQVIHLQQK